MSRRHYSNTAVVSYITSSLNGVDTTSTFSVSDTAGGANTPPVGWPSTPFFAAINRGQADEEVVIVTSVSGSSVTVTRGSTLATPYGATTQSHDINATIEHVASAQDFDEANDHINATSGVHGVTSDVVGVDDTQVLSNKTLTAATLTDPVVGSGEWGNAAHNHSANNGGNIPTSSVTGLDAAQTAQDAALAAHEADTSTHGVTVVAGLDETQTFTNKTLTSPTVNTPTINDAAIEGDTVFGASATVDIPSLAAVQSQENTTVSTSSTAWATLGSPVTCTVTVPPSGSVRIDLFARMHGDTGETAWMGYQVLENNSAGAEVQVEANARAVQVYGANFQSVAYSYILEGQTPGAVLFVRLRHKVTGGSGEWGNRVLIVTPMPG